MARFTHHQIGGHSPTGYLLWPYSTFLIHLFISPATFYGQFLLGGYWDDRDWGRAFWDVLSGDLW